MSTEYNSKKWQCMTEGDVRSRRLTPVVHVGSPLTENHRRICLQWAHEHRAWQADWHQVVFSDESRFNLQDHDGRIRVRRYDGERCLPEYVIEQHSDLAPGVMVWGVISHHGRSNLLRIEGAKNDENNNVIKEVVNLARQINLERDSDDVQDMPDFYKQELAIDELMELQEQDVEELRPSSIIRSNDSVLGI
ncbi:transposable element Tcb1 transposase [Trichonephila clavipes]|nr:transposable element Tcb1 transposase [Trichonephila clavipes]